METIESPHHITLKRVGQKRPSNKQLVAAIGRRIGDARRSAGLTQPQLAELIDTSAQQLQRWERGEYCAPTIRIYDLARVLGLPVGYFLGEGPLAPGENRTMTAPADDAGGPS